ncbi:hypothetical protein D893_02610 [Thioalkalivibrio sp. ALE21]|nr:hypothetical protein D893_02610 [Thioalkalivibrio sp. ALE21]
MLVNLGCEMRFRGIPTPEKNLMNNIIYIIGLIVVILFILGFFGLR